MARPLQPDRGATGNRGLWRFLRPYRGPLGVAAALTLAATVIDLARPWPLKLAVDHAIGGQPLSGALAPLSRLGPTSLAAVAALLTLALVGVSALTGYLITYLSGAAAERIGGDLREALFQRLLGLSLSFHDRHRSGDLVTRLTGDVLRVEDSLVAWLTTLVPEVLTLAGMAAVLLAVDRVMGLAALAVAPPLALVVALRRRRIRQAQRDSRDAGARLAAEATELLRNVRAVQAFTREHEAMDRFRGRSRTAVRAVLGSMDLEARYSPLADLLLAAGSGLVLWVGVVEVTGRRMTLGTLLVVLSYLSSLYGPIRSLARLARTLARGAASRERILEVLASGEVVPEAPAPLPARPLVPQDPWILDGTIAANIAFGRPGASAEEVAWASRLALVDEFAERLPDGYDTMVGESGVRLYGGQRQRIALARAILRDASVLLLDEPTSGLDAVSEQAVIQALERAARGRTVISVSHRLNLATAAGRVVVLDAGLVVEQGAPAELLADPASAFARLWAAQRPIQRRQPQALTPVAMERG